MDHPGKILQQRFLDPLGITAYRLAKGLGVQQTRISQILHGQRKITADTAVRLGAFFSVAPQLFLELQMNYDIEQSRDVAAEVSPFEERIAVSRSGARLVRPAQPAEPQLHAIPSELIARLEAQAALNPARSPREVTEVEYEGGMRGIVGVEP